VIIWALGETIAAAPSSSGRRKSFASADETESALEEVTAMQNLP
jgi:hypothetical protein